MTPRVVRILLVGAIVFACLGAGFWLHALLTTFQNRPAPAAASASNTSETLQAAFITVAERVRPAVVHVGTVQVARARRPPTTPGPYPDDPFFKEFFRSEEHTSELQSLRQLVCRLLLEKKKIND